MKWTPLGAVCSQIERPKMSLTGSRHRQPEPPISNRPDARALEYHLIMHLSHFPSRPLRLCFSVNHGGAF